MKTLLHIMLSATLIASSQAADWLTIQVPGKQDFTGTAWLRAWVKVHDSFFAKHERNLFEESVGVNIRDLAGAQARRVGRHDRRHRGRNAAALPARRPRAADDRREPCAGCRA